MPGLPEPEAEGTAVTTEVPIEPEALVGFEALPLAADVVVVVPEDGPEFEGPIADPGADADVTTVTNEGDAELGEPGPDGADGADGTPGAPGGAPIGPPRVMTLLTTEPGAPEGPEAVTTVVMTEGTPEPAGPDGAGSTPGSVALG